MTHTCIRQNREYLAKFRQILHELMWRNYTFVCIENVTQRENLRENRLQNVSRARANTRQQLS